MTDKEQIIQGINYKEEIEQYQEEIRTKLIDIQSRMVALNDDILRLSVLVQSGRFYNCMDGLTDDGQKKTIIDDINLSDIRSRLEDGQRASISTKEFENIIDLLEEKTQDCQRLEEENKKLQQTCEELNRRLELVFKENERLWRKKIDRLRTDNN